MALTKKSKEEKENKHVESAKSESKTSRKLKEIKKEKTTPTKAKKKNENNKKEKEKEGNKHTKIANGTLNDNVASIAASSSAESGEESKYELGDRDKSEVSNGRTSVAKSKKSKPKKKGDEQEQDQGEREDLNPLMFPMNRIRTIVKGEDPELRMSNEAVFVINKATEKFLERFTKDAHANCVQDRKKSLAYKHLGNFSSFDGFPYVNEYQELLKFF